MFWFLHYSVKVAIGLALIGMGAVLYANRHWFTPAEEWVDTLRRTQTETLPVLGETTGRVVKVNSGDTLTLRDAQGVIFTFRIAGVQAPPWSRHPRSEAAQAFRRSRDHLAGLALSNEVRVAYTFMAPAGGAGVGGVYSGETNLALPMLEAGLVIVHDPTLKGLPVPDQVQLLAVEKAAREGKRGFWADTVNRAARSEP